MVAGTKSLDTLKALKPRRLFLVSDPFFYQNGRAEALARLSGAQAWEIFHKVSPDPTLQQVAEGTAAVRQFQPDTLLCLGGGSAMDCGKAMAYFSECKPFLVAVPTTSGSGAEVTDFAVLTHGGQKYPLIEESLRPNLAILDDDLLRELPRGLIADSGFDVLAHAAEARAATGAGAITNALSERAFGAAFAALPLSWAGDVSRRLPLHKASAMAAMAFSQAGLGLCHALSHTLGGLYHIPHGRLNAILLPAVISANAPAAGGAYAALAREAGLSSATDSIAVRSLKNALCRLRRGLALPETLEQAGISPRQLREDKEKILKGTLQDPCCGTNPMPVTEKLIETVLGEVTGRG